MTDFEQQRHDLLLRLYVEHEESLRGFVQSLVPTLEDSREVMQDVAAVLWRKFEDITSMDDFRRWAYGVARFLAMEFLRTRRRDRHVFGEEALRLLLGSCTTAALAQSLAHMDHETGALYSPKAATSSGWRWDCFGWR